MFTRRWTEFEDSQELYSLKSLLRGAEKKLIDAVNPFAEMESVWEKYTAAVSMSLSLQYGIIIIVLIAVFLKYGVSEFSRTLLAVVFVDQYGVVDRKHIRRIYEPWPIEMEPTIKNASNIHSGVSAPS